MSSLAWFLVGALLAAIFYGALAYNTRRYLAGGPFGWAVLIHVGRWAVLIPALVGIALLGGRVLLPVIAGFALAHGAACAILWRRA